MANTKITVANMAANSIDSDQYVDGSIDTAHIADDAITSAKLDTNIAIAGTLGVTGVVTANARCGGRRDDYRWRYTYSYR